LFIIKKITILVALFLSLPFKSAKFRLRFFIKIVFLMHNIQLFFENQAFGVCTRLGEKLGISICGIRLFFIYSSFLTFGSPIIIYLSMAFIMNMRKHLRRNSHPSVWEF
jgi:phage shock protein PspC (stress-responsive transcriptional regulator)